MSKPREPIAHDPPVDDADGISRRAFVAAAASLVASLAVGTHVASAQTARPSRMPWQERRDLYPEGVASGDPLPDGVMLWTRRPPVPGAPSATRLTVEIAEDASFQRVVASARAIPSADADWTCRVRVAGLRPARVYWYRFADEHGYGSRVGRTITAPAIDDPRPVRFTFVSCQNVQQGACAAYRRMIVEDEQRERTAPDDRLGFVLHLGDFVYELVWYPEDRPQGMYDRRLRDIVRYAHGERHADFHVPTTVDDYRALYRAYLADPDLQDARARWPFVCMWDNHEFSWKGWQSQQNFGDGAVPAQTRKVAASQAWLEFQPARVTLPNGAQRFQPPDVADTPLHRFDANGIGIDPDNLAAIGAAIVYRTFRWGRHVELLLTDNRSYRSEPATDRADAAPFRPAGFPYLESAHAIAILDAGRTFDDGKPPATIRNGGADVPNPRRELPPQSMLGPTQESWFLDRLRRSPATWKLWGNSIAMLDWRTDPQHLPTDVPNAPRWPVDGYAQIGSDDWSGYRVARRRILDFVRRERVTGFVSLAGDRHAFTAGLLSTALPPEHFEPVGVEFITGSVSAPGLAESAEHNVPHDHPLRALYLHDGADGRLHSAINMSIVHGVRASLALARTGDVRQALAERNADVAPHLAFADVGGHGYTVIRADADAVEAELVCIPRPIERSPRPDGGPLAYRVTFRAPRWTATTPPRLERTHAEGTLPIAT